MTPTLLAQIWFAIICLEAALYVVLDGGNLGIGMLSLVPQPEHERETIMRAFGPMWDANETWLLIAAATTYGAFPMVYSIALNALYIPAFVFGVGLVLRVASYEFYCSSGQRLWRFLFGVASLLAVVGQGFLLGGFISGISIANGHFAGGPLDWATPVTALFTLGIVFGYLVLGYTRLINFASYELSPNALLQLSSATVIAACALIAGALLLPHANYLYFDRWTVLPSAYILYVIAACIAIVCAAFAYNVLTKTHVRELYYLSMAIFALGFVGMIVGVYPYILPPNVTIFEAASSPATQVFMLWGIGPILPIVLVYNYYIRRIFRQDGPEY
ncbi:MAG: cytochrome d ubiquinol oxidase subunit II [Candidatus Pacebacteria bacterium]|nr:cytochrome d ubiquinol oxidase subunit II [Candidatus Paceibacterota bacterium]